MGVYKLSSAGGLATPRTNYSSFLAGNPVFVPPSYESIATVTVGSGGAADVTFTSIPSTFTHLQIRGISKSTVTNAGNTYDYLIVQFNSDTGSNYSQHGLVGSGSSASAFGNATQTSTIAGFMVRADAAAANMFSASVTDILDYKSTSKYKTIRTLTGNDVNGTPGAVGFVSGLWQNTAAITSIVLKNGVGYNFAQYSQFALYGIRG
jgi:hypothetical protein